MSSTGGVRPAGIPRPFTLCPGVRALFTSRHGGVSRPPYADLNLSAAVGDDPHAVEANRARLLAALQAGTSWPAGVAWLRQVHGPAVIRVPGPWTAGTGRGGPAAAAGAGTAPGPTAHAAGTLVPEADAMYTTSPAVALGVMAADCAPVLLADPVAGICGAAHAGRPGLAAGVVTSLIAAMIAAGAEPARMHAVIGPVICGGCYEVPAALQAQVAAEVPEAACVTTAGTTGLDIAAGLRAQLTARGVAAVSTDGRCPAESADLFSYRRDGVTGRFAGLIWLAP